MPSSTSGGCARSRAASQVPLRELLVSVDRIAARVSWSGVLKISFGAFAAGDTLRAEIAQFVTIRDGRIAENQTYAC